MRLTDIPVDASVIGSGRSRSVLMGEPAMWTDAPKGMGVGTLLARSGLNPMVLRAVAR